MDKFLFHREVFDRLYNCSGRTPEEWDTLRNPSHLIGVMYACTGVVLLGIYLPFMYVMVKSDLTKYSCYKIMCSLGIIDIICLPNTVVTGYLSYAGAIFCTNPRLNYLCACLGLSCYMSAGMTGVVLALNRVSDFAAPHLARMLFAGHRTYVWLAFSWLYGMSMAFFTFVPVFNSNLYAYFFDPFLGTPERHGTIDLVNYPHPELTTHNIVIVSSLTVLYSTLSVVIGLKMKASITVRTVFNRMQRQIILQALLICFFLIVTSSLYTYMQFFPVPVVLVLVAQMTWYLSHGSAGMSYLFFNATLRREVMRRFCHKKIVSSVGDAHTQMKSVAEIEHNSSVY